MKTVRAGGLVGFVPAHCRLRRRARRAVTKAAAAGADFVYGDSLHSTDDRHEEPFQVLRPGWSPERLRGHNYVGDVVFAADTVVAAAAFATVRRARLRSVQCDGTKPMRPPTRIVFTLRSA